MAKQVGPVYYEGTIGDIVFYQMNGQYYARFKGNYKSLKQMKRIPKYQRVVRNTKHFGESSSIASWIYHRHLPKELKSRTAWGRFSSLASRLRNGGKPEKEIKAALLQLCEQLTLEAVAATKHVDVMQSEITTPGTSERRTSEHTVKQARYLPSPILKEPKSKPSLFAIPNPTAVICQPTTVNYQRPHSLLNSQIKIPPLSSFQ
jgi:hypothetical protein